VQSFPVGIGGEGKETPLGTTRIESKRPHPAWYPTASERAEDPDLPEVVKAGADNPMGDYALYLGWRGYAIHGTNRQYSIGRRDSHGCIRLYPEDIARLYAELPVGTPVTVVDQRVKLGWSGGELYVEVHPTQDEVDLIESGKELPPETAPEIDERALAAAGAAAGRIDWYALHLAAQRRAGVPVLITRP
jgi:L,D-transpeptidase ErfK/SrfK